MCQYTFLGGLYCTDISAAVNDVFVAAHFNFVLKHDSVLLLQPVL